ncbi:MAG: tRNA pseudouridine(55) synthase TruB [Arcobacteraceae bacterium]
MNRLFVIKKPVFISSNFYLNRIKRKYKNKKAGFSGTLDPFACGSLIVAFGQYSKLFRFLKKTPKSYRATIFLGAQSESLDIENVYDIQNIKKFEVATIQKELQSLEGKLEYLPPKYSAKKIDGKRAYALAREGVDFEMKKIVSEVFDSKFINYNHPFLTFELTVSEGSYIRSMAQILLERLGSVGTLSYLERLHEGKFFYDDEKALNPLEYLDLPRNNYTGTKEWFDLGKKLQIEYFENKDDGEYLIVFDTFFAVIEIRDHEAKYVLNKVLLND